MKSPLSLVLALLAPSMALAAGNAEELFVRRIVPLFHEKCLACHGKDEAKIKGWICGHWRRC
jgi:hypothetical protein